MEREYNKAEAIEIIEGSLWILRMQLLNLNAGRISPFFGTVAEQRKSWEADIERDEKKLAEIKA